MKYPPDHGPQRATTTRLVRIAVSRFGSTLMGALVVADGREPGSELTFFRAVTA